MSCRRSGGSELAEGVTAADVEVTELDYSRARDKSDKSIEAYKFFVNALYGHALAREVKQASAEDWQREASRLEAHGKMEQVEAIRSQVLRLQPTPWKPLDPPGLIELIDKALDPQGVSRKAREQLLDVLGLHPDPFSASSRALAFGR